MTHRMGGTKVQQIEGCTSEPGKPGGCALWPYRPLTGATKNRLKEERIAAMSEEKKSWRPTVYDSRLPKSEWGRSGQSSCRRSVNPHPVVGVVLILTPLSAQCQSSPRCRRSSSLSSSSSTQQGPGDRADLWSGFLLHDSTVCRDTFKSSAICGHVTLYSCLISLMRSRTDLFIMAI